MTEALAAVTDFRAETGASYLDSFEIEVPQGMNTPAVLEICRCIQDQSFESKVRMAKLCLEGKVVNVTCPSGEKESFCLGSADAGLEGIPLFRKEPAALIAIADAVQGYLLKKYLRLSREGLA